jgi:hypothetical protein
LNILSSLVAAVVADMLEQGVVLAVIAPVFLEKAQEVGLPLSHL